MSILATAPRLLVSPDGMRGANVHPADLANPLYRGWTDCTLMSDSALALVVAGRQLVALQTAA